MENGVGRTDEGQHRPSDRVSQVRKMQWRARTSTKSSTRETPLSSSLGSLAWQSTKQPRRSPTSLNHLARITENGTLDRALELLSCHGLASPSGPKRRKESRNEKLFRTACTRGRRSIVRRCNDEKRFLSSYREIPGHRWNLRGFHRKVATHIVER